jgi:sensor histidine kinase YesM
VLQAQVEPHFLFNTLAGVRSAVTGDPGRAVEIVDRLVDYLRASIPRLRSGGQAAEATLGAQLDIVRAYLALMSSRIPRLSFSIDAPDALLGLSCPPLMLISLAENAVKHGIEPKVGPGRIDVIAHRDGEGADARLHVTVRDDGVGFAAAQAASSAHAGTGIGLVNIRERLAQMYGPRAALTLKSPPEGGMAATLSLPVEDTP